MSVLVRASTIVPILAGVIASAVLLVAHPPHEVAMVWAVAATAAVAAVTWALVDPERFVLVVLLPAMILPVALAEPAGAQVALADLLLVVALGAWLARAATGQGPLPWVSGNRLLAPALLFAAVTVASMAWSVSLPDTVKSVVQIVEIVVALPLLFASLPRSPGTVRYGLLALVTAASALAIVTAGAFAARAAAGDISPQYLPGLHKNAIGSFVGAGLVIAYALRSAERRPWPRRLLGLAVIVQLAGLLASVSRGSMLGAAVAVVVASVLLPRGRPIAALAAAALVGAVFLTAIDAPARTDTRQPGGYSSALVRNYSFENAVEKIAERPLLGTGAGTYRDDIPELGIGLADPNNMFLLTAAELGVLGVAALVFLLWRFGGLLVAARRLPDEAAAPAVAAGAGAVSLLVHFQVDATWTRGSASLAFALMGLMLASGRRAPRGRAVVVPGPPAAPPSAPSIAAPSRTIPHTEPTPTAPRLRVLHVVTSDGFAGIERHVLRLARELRALGCDARLACPVAAERLRAEAARAGVPVYPSAGGRVRRWLSAAGACLGTRANDIIHVHDGRGALIGAALAHAGTPALVRTQHFTRPASAGRGGRRGQMSIALHRAVNRRLSAYIAVSQSVAASARRRGDTGGAEVTVIAPGIDPPDDDAVQRAVARREGLPAPVVALIGRLEREKHVDDLLRAIPEVRRRVPGCRFVIAGSGSAEPDLRGLAERLGVTGALTWTGTVADPATVLEGAHVYVNPTPEEGFGLAAAEAMAFALPVVAVASGASAELVEDGTSGLLVPPADASAMADAIARLAGDRAAAARMGHAARRRALHRYGAAATARRTLELYRRVGGGTGG